jgi:hypothetical protein
VTDHGTSTLARALCRRAHPPYCHYRARVMRERGIRERLVRTEAAPGLPFDHASFDLVVEPFDAPDERPARALDLVKLRRKAVA